jgi:class 3 adenylate cyclase
VTVLFVDIVGFTALVDEMDCEDVWALQKDYFAVVSRVVRDHGGVVEKYIGDAVMAVFHDRHGEPQHRESVGRGAARAVAAGLAVQQALRGRLLAGRFGVRTRAGVATGDAIVNCHETRDGGHAMISGSVVSTAARLQAYAPHDTVVVCAVTRRITDHLVAYQELPPVSVVGKGGPLDLWRALHPQVVCGPRADGPVTSRLLQCAEG